jgi:hypothetical protein
MKTVSSWSWFKCEACSQNIGNETVASLRLPFILQSTSDERRATKDEERETRNEQNPIFSIRY